MATFVSTQSAYDPVGGVITGTIPADTITSATVAVQQNTSASSAWTFHIPDSSTINYAPWTYTPPVTVTLGDLCPVTDIADLSSDAFETAYATAYAGAPATETAAIDSYGPIIDAKQDNDASEYADVDKDTLEKVAFQI